MILWRLCWAKQFLRVIHLPKNSASLILSINPKIERVKVNDNYYSEYDSLEIASGTTLIEINEEGYEAFSKVVNLEIGQTLNETINLKPIYGSL